MATKEHYYRKGKRRIIAETFHIDAAGQYVTWGASITKEKYVSRRVWYNIFSWFTNYYWKKFGEAPTFTLEFFAANGQSINDLNIAPTVENTTGFRKRSIIYFQIGVSGSVPSSGHPNPATPGISSLGTDARSVHRIVMHYSVHGQSYELEQY